MRRAIETLTVMGLVVLGGIPTQAQSGINGPGSDTIHSFLPTYARYVGVLQQHGLKGFESESIPAFTIREGNEKWNGQAAFKQVYSYLGGIQGGKVAVTIRRLSITGSTAVVLTRERLTFPSVRIGDRIAIFGPDAWYWKQTWQHTGRGWKLAAQELLSENALGPAPQVEYTVSADGHSIKIEEGSANPKMT